MAIHCLRIFDVSFNESAETNPCIKVLIHPGACRYSIMMGLWIYFLTLYESYLFPQSRLLDALFFMKFDIPSVGLL